MPDLPVELWSMVVSHLSNTHQSHTITHQADLCAIARVNSNANTAASSKLYAHVQVIDFDGLFEGYDHTPSEKRQPKKHWLSTIKSMRASFSYYDIAPRMGPAMTRLLAGHNHYDRLAEMMPNLSKVQLVSTFQGPLDYGRTPDYHCWTLLSLPAQHMCQSPYDKRAFTMGSRPSPATMLMHPRFDAMHYSTDEEYDEFDFADTIGSTGGRVDTLLLEPRSHPYNPNYDRADEFWSDFQERLEAMLDAESSLRAASTARFQFRLYGWVEPCQCCDAYLCEEKTVKAASGKQSYATFGDQRIPLELKFFSFEDRPTCAACGEREVDFHLEDIANSITVWSD